MTDGLPPYAALLGAVLAPDQDGGSPVLMVPFSDQVVGRPGFLHGGAIAGLLELAGILAIQAALDADQIRFKPINITVEFMRGARDRPTYARGSVTRLGTRIANVEAHAWQDDPGKAVASARMHCLLRR
jgi:uncharacterized protein (TIGR00369 family)